MNNLLVSKNVLLSLCSLVMASSATYAQSLYRNSDLMYVRNTSSLSLQMGGTIFLGDLGGTGGKGRNFIKDVNMRAVRPFVGIAYSYFPENGFSLNAEVHFTGVAGADSLINNRVGHAQGRYERNLSFRSFVYELQTTIDMFPVQLINNLSKAKLMPYVGTGIGFFHFNPQTRLNGEWLYLQPLHLEGQGFEEYPDRKNYKLTQFYLPLKVGVKYRIDNRYFFTVNALFRQTFTDYIDDVSRTYIDPSLFDKNLSDYAANVAKQLHFRGRDGGTPEPGEIRGYRDLDTYTSVYVSFTYLFNKGTVASDHEQFKP